MSQRSRRAIGHFLEYLGQFPDDLEVRWLLNLAHMTLGEHPDRVDPRFLISLDRLTKSEFDIGKFRDIGHVVGVNHLNQGGAGLIDDFDNDGLLDIVAPRPAGGATQVFRNVAADQAIEISEFADSYRVLDWQPIPTPE